MRIILFTGKGGVGKTTSAAGTAALAARKGNRTLVVSTDTAHSLADAFDTPVGPEPTELAPLLHAQQVDTQGSFERSWGEIQSYLTAVLDAVGVDPLRAEELTVIPGADEVLALLELRRQVLSADWDVVIVDCAPTAETLRLLALPEALGWYMRKAFPRDRRVVRALRPVLSRASTVPVPREGVLDAVARLHEELEDVHRILTGPDSSVRLVLTPERVVLAEARRAFTTLSMFGYRVDGVIANRVFPDAGIDPWRKTWIASQSEVLDRVAESFGELPVWRSPYASAEPVGGAALLELADGVYGGDDPLRDPVPEGPMAFSSTDGGGIVLSLALPFVERAEVDVARHGDDLVVTVGGFRRVLALPGAVHGSDVARARIQSGRLQIEFRPMAASQLAGARP